MDSKTLDALAQLDLAPGVTLDDVRKAYRELALIWHPDKVPTQVQDRATRKFTQLNAAYEWLTGHPETLDQPYDRPSPAPASRFRTGARREETPRESTYDNATMLILKAAGRWRTDAGEGLYVLPGMDRAKVSQFVAQVKTRPEFARLSIEVADVVIFYDIDGTGEEGIAITRTGYLINNNAMTLFRLDELTDIRVEDALFFWTRLSVRRKGQIAFEPAGYASKHAGRMLTQVIKNMV